MTLPLSETPTLGLGRFIKESRFVVPSHQRDFSWTDLYVTAFIRDVEEAKKKGSDIYFCGLMVFTRTSAQLLKVLDGQQRLATTLMIFSAIRNWFRQYSAYKKQEIQVETQLLQTDDIGASGIEPKLTLTPANNEVFQQFVINAVPVSDIEKAIKDRQSEDRNKTLLKAALYISDDDFKQRFRAKSETDGKKARYILRVLERQSLLRDGKTYADELIPGNVTLEHIFPKSPQAYWKEEAEREPKLLGMLNRLGNMCLLPDVNRSLGNKGWDEKLEVFKTSRLRTTNTIDAARYPKWGSSAIEKRQGYMAELAAAAWRFQ